MKIIAAELEERNLDLKTRENQLQGAEEEHKRCEQQLRETRVRGKRMNLSVTQLMINTYVLGAI